ncbi:DNA double-strand break repair nuclease NurA [Sulfolobus tengchongensis]|uniref:DNA double-strand break repair nuclease NurA n=1 Tax=Sulfolobus tengchongensis TaxID=207809 RepID=A0AAX4L5E2_9CREN
MTKKLELQVLLKDIISKYIVNYLGSSTTINVEAEEYIENDSSGTLISPLNEFMNYVDIRQSQSLIYSIDGSSRSFISSKGIISIASVVISSSITPIFGVYPPISGFPELDLKRPFLALASSSHQSPLIPFFYNSDFITTLSLDGTFFTSANSPEEIETEIRTVLETEALKKIPKDGSIILLDGPLIPPLIFLKSKVRDEVLKMRLEVMRSNVIGVVKRLDKSRLLISSLSKFGSRFSERFKIDPRKYFNDESFILDFIKSNLSPPYVPISLGPILRKIGNIPLYVNYLVYPLHPYVFKFSILRIESLVNDLKIMDQVSSLKFTRDGIPFTLAIADRTAKEITNAILRIVVTTLESMGMQASFYSKLEQVGI